MTLALAEWHISLAEISDTSIKIRVWVRNYNYEEVEYNHSSMPPFQRWSTTVAVIKGIDNSLPNYRNNCLSKALSQLILLSKGTVVVKFQCYLRPMCMYACIFYSLHFHTREVVECNYSTMPPLQSGSVKPSLKLWGSSDIPIKATEVTTNPSPNLN